MHPRDQCFHTNLSPELICHGCGMRFLSIYEETPFGLWIPVLRSGLLGLGFFFFAAYASVQLDSLLFAAIFVSLAVFFLVRAIRSVTEKHIPRLLREGGFDVRQLETMYVPSTPKIAAFTYWGFAT